MSTHTIDTAMARRMVEASAIRGASIIGVGGIGVGSWAWVSAAPERANRAKPPKKSRQEENRERRTGMEKIS